MGFSARFTQCSLGVLLALLAGCATGSIGSQDFDGDGTQDGDDCDPSNASIYPGAEDPYGDTIDQDCDGVDGDAGDLDNDGTANEDDCAPEDADIYPGADDTYGDDIDQNCDGIDGIDSDGDGYASTDSGGDDCNDGDAGIHPGAEDPDDAIDQDCDGFGRQTTVDLRPDAPTTSDALYIQVDSDSAVLGIAWFLDGVERSEYAGFEEIPYSQTSREQTWRVEVTPYNASAEVGTAASDSVIIGNSAPTISSVSIVPAPAYSIDTLTCSYTGYADLDGDPDASTFNWTVNGAPAGTASTLAGSFAAGDTVVCTVTPFDGTLQGALDTATTTIASPPCPLVVETTGTSTGVGSAARPFGTLQAAVDGTALGSCLAIDLGPGEYVESVNLADRNVVIVGRDGPAWTVLRAVSGRALSISGGQSSACSVSGITFTGGRCLGIGNGSSPVIRDNVFDACTSSGSGAAIGIGGGANPEIFDNDFDSNVSSNGGAISVTGGASPHIHDNDFSDNSAVNGGAIYNSGGAALIQNNDFIDNDASQKGGAVSNHSGSSTSILGNYFRRNQGQWGGGVHCHGSNLTMSSNTYSSNSPSSNYCSPTCSGCSNN